MIDGRSDTRRHRDGQRTKLREESVRCPACTPELCVCRSEQLGLLDGLDDQAGDAVAAGAELDDAEILARPAVDHVPGLPDVRADVDRAEIVAVDVEEAEGRHVWTLRAVPEPTATVAWLLTGGLCAGDYDAVSTWPPPETIRAVVAIDGATAVLDLADDEPELGETIVLYRLESHGFMCGDRSRSPLVASYFPAGFTEKERMLAARAVAFPEERTG